MIVFVVDRCSLHVYSKGVFVARRYLFGRASSIREYYKLRTSRVFTVSQPAMPSHITPFAKSGSCELDRSFNLWWTIHTSFRRSNAHGHKLASIDKFLTFQTLPNRYMKQDFVKTCARNYPLKIRLKCKHQAVRLIICGSHFLPKSDPGQDGINFLPQWCNWRHISTLNAAYVRCPTWATQTRHAQASHILAQQVGKWFLFNIFKLSLTN